MIVSSLFIIVFLIPIPFSFFLECGYANIIEFILRVLFEGMDILLFFAMYDIIPSQKKFFYRGR